MGSFIKSVFEVFKEVIITFVRFFIQIYKIIFSWMNKLLPDGVANVFMIMIACIIVGLCINHLLRDKVK